MMLQAYTHVVRMLPIQLDLGQWRQSLIKHFQSLNKTTKTKERRRERPRQRKTEPERKRQIEREKHTKRQRDTKGGGGGDKYA